jgi:hypothetical protein
MRLIFIAAATLLASQTALASTNFVSVSAAAKVDEIVSAIPARKSNLTAVLRSYGLTADSALLSEPEESDINDGSFLIRRGDRFIDIRLREPVFTNPECPVMQTISFTLRHGKYLPESRTANFLFSGKCQAPDR